MHAKVLKPFRKASMHHCTPVLTEKDSQSLYNSIVFVRLGPLGHWKHFLNLLQESLSTVQRLFGRMKKLFWNAYFSPWVHRTLLQSSNQTYLPLKSNALHRKCMFLQVKIGWSLRALKCPCSSNSPQTHGNVLLKFFFGSAKFTLFLGVSKLVKYTKLWFFWNFVSQLSLSIVSRPNQRDIMLK